MIGKRFMLAVGLTALAAVLTILSLGPAWAADYPTKPIRMTIPYPPGGGSDLLTRLVDKYTKDQFGHNFVFQYKPGAGGAVGASAVAKAKPDGYDIGTVNIPHTVLQQLTKAGDFTVDSFEYLGQVASNSSILLTPAKSEIKTLKQFIDAAKAQPGRLTVGIPGAMGSEYVACLKMMEVLGIKFTIVPSKGGADLLAAILGGHVDAALHNTVIVAPERDKMNLIACAFPKRDPYVSDVPTFRELGFDLVSFIGRIYVGPKGIPADRLKKLRDGFKAAFDKPACQEDIKKANYLPDWMSGEEIKKFLIDYTDDATALLKKYKKI